MSVNDVVVTEVITADSNTAIADVAARMKSENVGSVLVLDESELVGILTDRDVALSLADDPDATDRRAGDVMTEDPVTVGPDASVFELLERMDSVGVRRMPVVEDGTVAGIVALDDVLGLLAEEFEDAMDVVDRQSPAF